MHVDFMLFQFLGYIQQGLGCFVAVFLYQSLDRLNLEAIF